MRRARDRIRWLFRTVLAEKRDDPQTALGLVVLQRARSHLARCDQQFTDAVEVLGHPMGNGQVLAGLADGPLGTNTRRDHRRWSPDRHTTCSFRSRVDLPRRRPNARIAYLVDW
jgi:hypothetical protein